MGAVFERSSYGLGAIASACLVLASGCSGSDPMTDPTGLPTRCEQDRFDCQDIDQVPPAPGCEPGGELVVTIGYGFDAFSPAGVNEAPPTIEGTGGFQAAGSSHTVFALRIEGAALDRYDVLGADIGVYEALACSTDADIRSCNGLPWIASRTVLLGGGPPLNVVGDVVEEFGITAPMDPQLGSFVVQAVVEDPCGVLGIAHHDFAQ